MNILEFFVLIYITVKNEGICEPLNSQSLQIRSFEEERMEEARRDDERRRKRRGVRGEDRREGRQRSGKEY